MTPFQADMLAWRVQTLDEVSSERLTFGRLIANEASVEQEIKSIGCEKIMTSDYEGGYFWSLSLLMDPLRPAFCNKKRVKIPVECYVEQYAAAGPLETRALLGLSTSIPCSPPTDEC